MKNRFAAFFAVSFMATLHCLAQNVVLFTNVFCTTEGAIKLTWTSVSNETYQIQCSSVLSTNMTWETLYDEYPSQGSNTFFLDTGNYFSSPPVVHPKYASERFYRILDEGQDTLASDEPTAVVVSPASSSVISGVFNVAVTNYSDQAMVVGNLYIDGELMKPSLDGTNYVINSCEFANGKHLIFATATAYSSATAENGNYALIGHSVSTMVPVYFSNLISEISFSQVFFQPSLGQTQEITASLAANCDWTLTIDDGNTNVFKTVTGTGNSVSFAWNGTSDGGTNVPPGEYYYYINATTNGLPIVTILPPPDTNNPTPPTPMFSMESGSSSLWAIDTNTESVVPMILYPPGFDTNDLTIISATPAEAASLRSASDEETTSATLVGGGIHPDDFGSQVTASSQNSGATPTRAQYTGTAGSRGNFAVAYDTYIANGYSGYFQPEVPYSYNYGGGDEGFVQIEGHGTADPPKWGSLPWNANVALKFATALIGKAWNLALTESDNQLTIGQLKAYGDSNPLNTNDFAMLLLHGGYGTTADMSTGQNFKQCYFPITINTGANYLRMSDLNLGGDSTNSGLKWLAFNACYSLYPANWNSMQSQNVSPYNSNMHMILGGATETVSSPSQGTFFAQDMLGNPTAIPPIPAMTLRNAWYDSFRRGMQVEAGIIGAYPNPTQLTVACNPNCLGDYLQTQTNTVLSTANSGKWILDTPVQVFP